MGYILVMQGRKGLKFGKQVYKTAKEARERQEILRRAGIEMEIMSYGEAYK